MTDARDLSGQVLHLEHSYEVVEAIHRGPMATLYAAEWQPLGAPVVLRSWQNLIPLRLRHSTTQRIIRAIRSPAALTRRAGLPDVVDIGEEDSARPFIVMRLPPGVLLLEYLENGETFDATRCTELVRQVTAALTSLREAGLTHRGPTADRIWLGDDGTITLLGAGEVLYRDDTASMRGKPYTELLWHVPPESFVASGRPGSELGEHLNKGSLQGTTLEDDPRAEVYALGCLTYHALTGHHPFFVHRSDVSSGVRATLMGAPLELDGFAEDSPFAGTVFRAMARDPEDRFASPTIFAEALPTALNEERPTSGESRAPINWITDDATSRPAERADERGDADARSAPPGDEGLEKALRIWRAAAVLLTLLLAGYIAWERLQPVSVIITTDPPAVELAEKVGHTFEPRGTAPIVLRRRPRSAPIELQVVGPDGTFGEAQTYSPASSRGFQDLGRCVRLPLTLEFPFED